MNLVDAVLHPRQLLELLASSERSCTVFADHPLPHACSPSRGRVGVECPNGIVKLLVELNLGYAGDNEAVANWIRRGEIVFSDPTEFQQFVLQHFGPIDNVERAQEGAIARAPSHASHHSSREDLAPENTGPENSPSHVDEAAHVDSVPTVAEIVEHLGRGVRGQRNAITAVATYVERQLLRVEPTRPISIMLAGNTGTGKGHTAKSLADLLGERLGYRFLRVDLNEYHESHRIAQLLGSPPGYVGSDQPGLLEAAFAVSSKVVVLFDEVEKADPAVMRALMAMLDEGRVTKHHSSRRPFAMNQSTATGNTRVNTNSDANSNVRSGVSAEVDEHGLSCREAVILFTTNLDATDMVHEVAETRVATDPDEVDALCRRRFRAQGWLPELVGRVSNFVVFEILSRTAILEIAIRAIQREAASYGFQLRSIEPALVHRIAESCDDPQSGARDIATTVSSVLGDALGTARRELALSRTHCSPTTSPTPIAITNPEHPVAKQC